MKKLAFCKFIPNFISMLLAASGIVISAAIAGAEPPSLTPPQSINLGGTAYSKENRQWHQTRYALYRQTIENELQKKTIPIWAGKWSNSTGYTSNEFLVSPSGLFVKNELSDVGGGDWKYGTAQFVSGQFLLRLAPGFPAEYRGGGFIPGPYLVIWDNTRFIIEPHDMLAFVNNVNAHINPQTICGYGKNCFEKTYTDSQKKSPSKTLPQVPPPWDNFLLREPVTAKILSQYHYTTVIHEEYKTIMTRFTIDRGTNSGLKPGMTMYFTPKQLDSWKFTVTVETVSENSAVVEFSDDADINSARKLHQYNPPRVGQTLSTRDISEVALENYIKKHTAVRQTPQSVISPNK